MPFTLATVGLGNVPLRSPPAAVPDCIEPYCSMATHLLLLLSYETVALLPGVMVRLVGVKTALFVPVSLLIRMGYPAVGELGWWILTVPVVVSAWYHVAVLFAGLYGEFTELALVSTKPGCKDGTLERSVYEPELATAARPRFVRAVAAEAKSLRLLAFWAAPVIRESLPTA